MTREEFITGKINSANDSISQANAQLVTDASKPRVSKSLLSLIEINRAQIIRLDTGILNEGELFHLDTINSK